MKQSTQYRIIAVITLLVSSFSAFAQGKAVASIEVDTLTKVIGIGLTIGGFFMGYMQMRMANKIAEVEARFNKAIAEVKDKFEDLLDKENAKLETKIQLSGKEIEARMATKHDIDNVKTQIKMQHEITSLQINGIKEQLTQAAKIYKKDND